MRAVGSCFIGFVGDPSRPRFLNFVALEMALRTPCGIGSQGFVRPKNDAHRLGLIVAPSEIV